MNVHQERPRLPFKIRPGVKECAHDLIIIHLGDRGHRMTVEGQEPDRNGIALKTQQRIPRGHCCTGEVKLAFVGPRTPSRLFHLCQGGI